MTSKELIDDLIRELSTPGDYDMIDLHMAETPVGDNWQSVPGYTEGFEAYLIMKHLPTERFFETSCENGGSWASLVFNWNHPSRWEEVEPHLETVTRYRVVRK